MSDRAWQVTVYNKANGETATVTAYASDPDDACCLDGAEFPEEWGDDPDIEVLGVEWD